MLSVRGILRRLGRLRCTPHGPLQRARVSDAGTHGRPGVVSQHGGDMEADNESEGLKPARKRIRTPEQQAQDALRKRLQRVQKRILSLQKLLVDIHEDRSGMYHFLSCPGSIQHRELREMLARIEGDAAAGCVESVNFLLANAERIGWIEYHANKRPPPRDPTWKPAPIVRRSVPRAPWRAPRSDFHHWRPHLEKIPPND